MKNSADLRGCYPPWPSASVDNTLLDLRNSSCPTQPHIIITKYSIPNLWNSHKYRNFQEKFPDNTEIVVLPKSKPLTQQPKILSILGGKSYGKEVSSFLEIWGNVAPFVKYRNFQKFKPELFITKSVNVSTTILLVAH